MSPDVTSLESSHVDRRSRRGKGRRAGRLQVLISPYLSSPVHPDLGQGKLQKTDPETTKNPRPSEACGPLPRLRLQAGSPSCSRMAPEGTAVFIQTQWSRSIKRFTGSR